MFLIMVLGALFFGAVAVLMFVVGIPVTLANVFWTLLLGAGACFLLVHLVDEFVIKKLDASNARRHAEELQAHPRDIAQAFSKEKK
jgi:hypothetical protein